jgi:MYXO-CTERM domain-containing protein
VCAESDPGDYDCICDSGYEKDAPLNGTCSDIDECTRPELSQCAEDATCANSVGGFTCTCDPGFAGDGRTCTDVDECADVLLNECSPNAMCLNAVGSYSCECRPGFEGSGVDCRDEDECATANPCERRSERCVNLVGMPPLCECAPGFSRDAAEGECVSSCGNGERVRGEECDDGGLVDGDGCSALCEVEDGWSCWEPTEPRSVCRETCGDGVLHPNEECDSGEANSDETPNACRERCVEAFCGDGVIDEGEGCDDGDANSDRSAGACRLACVPAFCGDGVIDEGEECDPGTGASTAADACTSGCPRPDAGMPGADAGVTEEPDGGCGCSTPGAPSRSGGLALLGLALGAIFVRRSRRR